MKLSEKGLKRLLDVAFDGDEFYQSNALEVEFEPDDFDGCFQNGKDHIILTVEEAKGLLEISRDYRMYLFEHCRIPLSLSVNAAFTALRERIEQAEKSDGED